MPSTFHDKFWIEQYRDSQKSFSTTEYSSRKSTQHLTPIHALKVYESYIIAEEGCNYDVKIKFGRHLHKASFNIIVDGVDQGLYLASLNPFLSYSFTIQGRQIAANSLRKFRFSPLKVEEGAHNYNVDEKAHAEKGLIRGMKDGSCAVDFEPMQYMVGKSAVGTIRINLHKVGKTTNVKRFDGDGDYEICDKVDEIGQLKMFTPVKMVTGLDAATPCTSVASVVSKVEPYPYKSFVFYYRTQEDLASQNLLNKTNSCMIVRALQSLISLCRLKHQPKRKKMLKGLSEKEEAYEEGTDLEKIRIV